MLIARYFLVLLLLFGLGVQKVYAWGREGHVVVADIAERFINQDVRGEIHSLLQRERLACVLNEGFVNGNSSCQLDYRTK